MDNSSLNATEIAVGSLLAGRGGYGGGYGGAWGEGYNGCGPWATPSANAVRINRNSQEIENQADCTREVLGAGLRSIDNNFENAERARQFTDVRSGQFQSELRTNDRIRDLENRMIENATAAAKCCCETQLGFKDVALDQQKAESATQLKMAEMEARLAAEIKASESRTIQRDLDRAERELQTQKIISTCGCGCGGGVRPCPPA